MTADTVAALSAMDDAGADDEPGGYLSPCSPGRMAALLLLGKYPAGVSSAEIRAAIRTADPRVWDEQRMKFVLRRLSETGLVGTERDAFGVRWFSHGARQVARLRGEWPPATPRRTA